MTQTETLRKWQNEKEEAQVICQAIEERGVITTTALLDFLKVAPFNLDISEEELAQALERLETKDVITRRFSKSKEAEWALRDMPFPPKSSMDKVKGTRHPAAQEILKKGEELEDTEAKPTVRGKYCDYRKFLVTWETVDPILGGDITNNKRFLAFPKKPNGEPTFRQGWFHGWLRDNGRTVGLPVKIQAWVGFSEPTFPKPVELTTVTARVLQGFSTYEALPKGTVFQTLIKYPMRGTPVHSKEELLAKLTEMGLEPIRGFGSNARYYGGRIKPTKIEEINQQTPTA